MNGLTSIIILTYNQLSYTRLCLESIFRWTSLPYQLVIIDNGSSDGTINYLQTLSGVSLVCNQENRGFSKGVNQGIKLAQGEQILLLNNDTIVARNWLRNQVLCLRSKADIGIVGPRSNCAALSQGFVPGDFSSIEKITSFSNNFNCPAPAKWFETKQIVGFCMLLKRELIKKVGFFDERYDYGLFEDHDYCNRASQNGFKLYCAGDTFVYHFGGRTFQGNKLDHALIKQNNLKLFQQKWGEK